MAKKPFYSMDEVCEKLGKSQDEIKDLVRDGTLREFRDAGKVFFKAEEIDKLSGGGAGDEIMLEAGVDLELEPGDSGEGSTGVPALTESSGGTSIIGLEPLEGEEEEEADEEPPPPEEEEKEEQEDTVITSSGIGVFDDDELEIDADPMAKTQITTGTTEDDQISLEGAGSGSGLLDLAREADDTALGADLLDEIYPGEEEAGEEAEAPEEEAVAEPEVAEPEEEAEEEEEALEEVEAAPEVAMPVAAVAAGDPLEGVFSGLLVGSLVLMAVAMTVVAGALQGFLPSFAGLLSDGSNFYFFLGGSALLVVLALVVGWFLGKAFMPRR
jgi:hypothetical protein